MKNEETIKASDEHHRKFLSLAHAKPQKMVMTV
jgi:hypothetical protein